MEKNIEELKSRFGNHVVLQKLEGKMQSFASYQRIIYLLNNDKLRPRHWEILLEKTSVATEDEYLSFQLNLFLHLEQSEFENIIVDVIEIAQEEARIEEELTAIRDVSHQLLLLHYLSARWLQSFYVLMQHNLQKKSIKMTKKHQKLTKYGLYIIQKRTNQM